MEAITIHVLQDEVYEEVAKATDYTGSKLVDADDEARDRILAGDDELSDLSRFWDESVLAVNENFKEMLINGETKQIESKPGVKKVGYEATIEVSRSFDKVLTSSVQSTLRSFFIASIIGQWFKFANKGEANEYFTQSTEMIEAAERLLYSRKRPTIPTD